MPNRQIDFTDEEGTRTVELLGGYEYSHNGGVYFILNDPLFTGLKIICIFDNESMYQGHLIPKFYENFDRTLPGRQINRTTRRLTQAELDEQVPDKLVEMKMEVWLSRQST